MTDDQSAAPAPLREPEKEQKIRERIREADMRGVGHPDLEDHRYLLDELARLRSERYCEKHRTPHALAADSCPACLFEMAVADRKEVSKLRSDLAQTQQQRNEAVSDLADAEKQIEACERSMLRITATFDAENNRLEADLAQTQAEKEDYQRKYLDCPSLDCPYERRMKEAEAALTRLSSERPRAGREDGSSGPQANESELPRPQPIIKS